MKQDNQTPPTANQISTLHAQLIESKSLASQLNYPLSNLAFSGIMYTVTELLLEMVIPFLRSLMTDESEPEGLSYLFVLAFAVVAAKVIFSCYRHMFHTINSAITYVLPNGLGFSFKQHPAFKLENELKTQAQVVTYTRELELLITQQNRFNLATKISFFTNVFIPFINCCGYQNSALYFRGGTLFMTLTQFGPAFGFENHSIEPLLPNFILNLAYKQQALFLTQSIYNFYTNRHKDRQFDQFKNTLNQVTLLNTAKHQWLYLQNNPSVCEAALFCLKLDRKVSVQSTEGFISLSRQNYLTELHRILCYHNIPALRSSEALYVGFISKNLNAFKADFKQCIHKLIKIKKQTNDALCLLNHFSKKITNNEYWSSYTDITTYHKHTVSFFCNIKEIPAPLQDTYVGWFSTAFHNLKKDVHILIFTLPLLQQTEHLEYIAPQQPIQSIIKTQDDHKLPERKDKRHHHTTIEASKPEIKIWQKIQFNNGTYYDEQAYQQQIHLPKNFAYPIQLPHIPQGHAFVTIHPKLPSVVANYITQARIQSILHTGICIGKRQQKSKAGNVGIIPVGQGADNPNTYKDVNGTYHNAQIKLKNSNNIRLFGRRIQRTENGDVLYVLDGGGYGH